MALPTSGNLSIKAAAGTSRSIALEVDGNNTGSKSLNSLGVTAGVSAGGTSMLEFYGYSSVVVPNAVSGVFAEDTGLAGINGSIVRITWQDNSNNEDRFRIEVVVNSGGYQFVANVSGGINKDLYDHDAPTQQGAVSGDSLRYRVRAENTAGASAWAYSNTFTYFNGSFGGGGF